MNNTQLQLVTFEQANKLDSVGFDWPTRLRYDYCYEKFTTETTTDRNHNDRHKWTNKDKQGCSAPTVALALKWMRDVKGIACAVNVRNEIRVFSNKSTYVPNFIKRGITTGGKAFDTYEAAERALLDELLKLIEK
jgi:hypothetical protein